MSQLNNPSGQMNQSEQALQILSRGAEGVPWYVVHTCCRHEARVEQRLQKLGLETFLPRHTVLRHRRDRRKHLQAPLFPGYLFIQDHLEPDVFHAVLRLPGVVTFVSFGNQLQPVPPATIASIKAALNSERHCFPHRFLLKGKRVRVMNGPLAGVIGIVKESKTKKRTVVIEVALFRQALAVELEADAVEPWS